MPRIVGPKGNLTVTEGGHIVSPKHGRRGKANRNPRAWMLQGYCIQLDVTEDGAQGFKGGPTAFVNNINR